MILVDADLLLYAYDSSSAHHVVARDWLERVFSRPEPVRIAWITLLAFLRVSTDSRLRGERFSPQEAVAIIEEWRALPNFDLLAPGERHWEILAGLLPASQSRGPLVMDADLAALAMEHGALLCTTDRDFTRFPGLRWENPLVTARSL